MSMACLLVTAALATLVQGSLGVSVALQDVTPFFMILLNTATVLALAGFYARLLARAHCATARLYGGRLVRGCHRCRSLLRRSSPKPLRSAVPASTLRGHDVDGSSGAAATDASSHSSALAPASARTAAAADANPQGHLRRIVVTGGLLPAGSVGAGAATSTDGNAGDHGRAAAAAAFLAHNKSSRAAAAVVRPARLQLAATRVSYETA